MQYSNSYTHTNLSIFNCYLNISVRSTHIQHFCMVNLVNLLIFPLLKRRKSEDLDLRPNPRKSLIFQAFSHFYFCVLVNNTTVSTIVSFSKGNSFTSVPFTGTGKLKIIFLIQLPSGCLSGNNSIRSINARINSFRSTSEAAS